MSDTSNANRVIRLDPAPSKPLSWLEWEEAAEAVFDDRGRTIRPAGPTLRVRYRYNGSEKEYWPVSEEEAKAVMDPGPIYGYSIGSAFSQLISSHKSGRAINSADRQETKAQRTEIEQRAGRRWLA
jgi:hypothetical protein